MSKGPGRAMGLPTSRLGTGSLFQQGHQQHPSATAWSLSHSEETSSHWVQWPPFKSAHRMCLLHTRGSGLYQLPLLSSDVFLQMLPNRFLI